LIDELRIILNPILLGSGTPLFKGSYGRVPLRLVDSRSFDTGAMVLLYEPQ
jgi:dihydrofolate reductase